ncbi:MAG: murG [Rickettsiaceae bacterium]|jgi:UDP-N-acetylglucosamine--N-acetylmuramyl-(pentapeptide) pyrophosphoryl-undecaprenol N-acetylglucosamine transferase|nr:murG [Rickettsiaceae bacterium]
MIRSALYISALDAVFWESKHQAMKNTIIITTGGTGGHIFPAQTIADKLSKKGLNVVILGDKNYAKYHKPHYQYKFQIIGSAKINKSPLALAKSAARISYGIFQSMILLLKYQPKVVIGFGGYSTFPVLCAAVTLGKKIILHEQNAHLGKVNRIFAKFADKIALSYLQTDGLEPGDKTVFTGNPIREEIAELQKLEYQLPDSTKQLNIIDNLGYDLMLASQFYNYNKSSSPDLFNILVIGGSGGAKIFSEILPRAFFNLRDEVKKKISITQQCRSENLHSTFEQYKSFSFNILMSEFFDDMPAKISKAHLIISRAGSSSIAEFTCSKRPMILVPFALAADNHQEKNAREIEKSGAAIVVREKDFTINNLTGIIEKLIDNPALLQKMSAASFKCSNIEAGDKLTKLIINTNNE